MKLQDNNGQYKLTLPKDIVKALGWKGGTELVIGLDSTGDLFIKEIKKK